MRKLLIPLLAALSFSTPLSAKIIRLDCGGTEFSINEDAGKATISSLGSIIKTTDVFASSDLFIIDYKVNKFILSEYQIDRSDGSYSYKIFGAYTEFDESIGLDRSIVDERRKKAKFTYGESPCKKVQAKKNLF